MDHTKLQEHLWLYGADITTWPSPLQEEAQAALIQNPALRERVEEEQAFEQLARSRPMLREDSSFAERIIAIAHTRQSAKTKMELFWGEIQDFIQTLPFPKPAYSLATFAVLGVLIGMASQQEAPSFGVPNNFLYEVGEVL